MGWKSNVGNPQPRAQGDQDAQAAIIARMTANRRQVPDAPVHRVIGNSTVRAAKSS